MAHAVSELAPRRSYVAAARGRSPVSVSRWRCGARAWRFAARLMRRRRRSPANCGRELRLRAFSSGKRSPRKHRTASREVDLHPARIAARLAGRLAGRHADRGMMPALSAFIVLYIRLVGAARWTTAFAIAIPLWIAMYHLLFNVAARAVAAVIARRAVSGAARFAGQDGLAAGEIRHAALGGRLDAFLEVVGLRNAVCSLSSCSVAARGWRDRARMVVRVEISRAANSPRSRRRA